MVDRRRPPLPPGSALATSRCNAVELWWGQVPVPFPGSLGWAGQVAMYGPPDSQLAHLAVDAPCCAA